MNKITEKSKHPYYHVILGKNQDHVTLCILNGNGKGGYDHWKVDKNGHERCCGFSKDSFVQDYWQDYVDSDVIRNIYNVLDFYVKYEDNVVELNPSSNSFCADDIPF